MHLSNRTPSDKTQNHLLLLAAGFLILYSIALTLSAAVRLRSWQVNYRYEHWLLFVAWVGMFTLAHRATVHWLPEHDPYLLPLAAILTGWGTLTIWRLDQSFGLRQTAWLVVAVGIFTLGLRLPSILSLLRKYKYIWLSSGLVLTGLTLFLGTNPMGEGPRLWLGCCGVYFQPSEPLKLLLVVYLAAYLADRQPYLALAARPSRAAPLLPLLAPTLVMIGLVLLLLFAQRDLGTASIFLILYAIVVYVASGNVRILVLSALLLIAAGTAGYILFDIVQQRIDAWLNPWLDPSGGSYQIVQSLIAIANGGITGRGPGLGSPVVIPIAHSDFIFSAITEESGLIGALGLLVVLALFASRGMRIALRAENAFRRYLAAGLIAHIVVQSLLIIAGNIRLLPLTGVTLPFVSYGGSSLLTSYLSLLLLIHISKSGDKSMSVPITIAPYRQMGIWFMLGLGAAGLVTGWWAIYRAPTLIVRTDNPRRSISDRFVKRGSLLTRGERTISESILEFGDYIRVYQYPDLGPIAGYNSPTYGLSGLENSLDPYLRGISGNPTLSIWWSRLLYGQPPPGLDIRLSLDLDLQRIADGLLSGHRGALVLMNASSGEILVMASHPTFNANVLDEEWENLVQDEDAPFLDRSALGQYPLGAATGPFMLALSVENNNLPQVPRLLSYELDGITLNCAAEPVGGEWGDLIAAGCPNPVAILGRTLGSEAIPILYDNLGFYSPPQIRLPTTSATRVDVIQDPASASLGFMGEPMDPEGKLLISPLQMAIAAGTISNHGSRPAPRLAVALNTTQSGWIILPPLSQASKVFSSQAADSTAASLAYTELPVWQCLIRTPNEPETDVTWYLGGTLPDWQGAPLAITLVLEEDATRLVEEIGQTILQAATQTVLP